MSQPTDSTNMKQLDEALNSPGQLGVRQLVGQLPEDVPNLVWRSRLNERLAQSQQQSRRRRLVLRVKWGGFAATAGLAATMGLILLSRPAITPALDVSQEPGIEAAMITAHREADSAMDVSSATVSESFVAHRSKAETPPFQWSEADLEAL